MIHNTRLIRASWRGNSPTKKGAIGAKKRQKDERSRGELKRYCQNEGGRHPDHRKRERKERGKNGLLEKRSRPPSKQNLNFLNIWGKFHGHLTQSNERKAICYCDFLCLPWKDYDQERKQKAQEKITDTRCKNWNGGRFEERRK